MISTSSHNDWQSDKYITYSISGNRGKDVNYQGKCYSELAPKLSFLKVWHNNIGRISEEENNRYYVQEYWNQVLSKLDPEKVFRDLDYSVLLCYEPNTEFCHRHIVAAWFEILLGVKVPVTTLCPCSKEISDYGAHNQRAIVSVKVSYDRDEHIWIEDLIKMVEDNSSCGLYSLLKREDEKFVTEHAYNNPKFVEDVLRDVVLALRNNDIVDSFTVECESIESIHNHSAWAFQSEG